MAGTACHVLRSTTRLGLTWVLGPMNKYLAGFIAAVLSSLSAFAIHVFSQEWVLAWITEHIQGHEGSIATSWDVRYVAAVTSVETGVGLVVLYALLRSALPFKSSFLRGLILGVLLLAVMGSLLRQPFMNLVVGNPLSVVVVQDGITWIVWLVASVIVALTYDWLSPRVGPNSSCMDSPVNP